MALNDRSHGYDFLKEGAHDVKWDQLICQNLQLNAIKIRIRIAAVRSIYVLVICHAISRIPCIRKAAPGVDILQRPAHHCC
jgi:hypothetical protein